MCMYINICMYVSREREREVSNEQLDARVLYPIIILHICFIIIGGQPRPNFSSI